MVSSDDQQVGSVEVKSYSELMTYDYISQYWSFTYTDILYFAHRIRKMCLLYCLYDINIYIIFIYNIIIFNIIIFIIIIYNIYLN